MARYVLIRIESDVEADRLIEDARDYPDNPILTPSQENDVHATVVNHWSADADCPPGCTKPCCQPTAAQFPGEAGEF
jgi:hypothetical protein